MLLLIGLPTSNMISYALSPAKRAFSEFGKIFGFVSAVLYFSKLENDEHICEECHCM